MKVAVIGAGSFGTVLADIAAHNDCFVRIYARRREVVDAINQDRKNPNYQAELTLHTSIEASDSLEYVVEGAELVLLSVPSIAMDGICCSLKPLLPGNVALLSMTKGIRADGFKLMSQVISERLPGHPVGVLSGPNLAGEIAQRHLTASVVASASPLVRELARKALATRYFRLYSSEDLISVELGGALKNIYAIAAGLADGLKVGENTKALLITRALAEMSRLSSSLGGNPLSFLGLAGVGDLYVTSVSPLSRNFRVGRALAEGVDLKEAQARLGQVAEGINTLQLVHAHVEKNGIVMPILEALYQVIFGGRPVRQMALQMMQAVHTSDVEFLMPGANQAL
ncbi:NAD(P)-dependent glycerol-3-phosphate dehydrogenase [Litorivicinus sp.]|nr:NAD(P)-dependent glycerol-3-phosphate dehydrogenase [Litorivicinus sp.]MDC1207757.1 NAD(P)-dependent glycerol-3-phosphate dehydrogenase [Litorivicinus sp.]MDC1240564.1 NAD(P)-dependent glycerol-3-phosphate dehydrogenase [Litorivicinus sp.]MDC1466634.1 NAD(P)-dependent glycerol-3-phosphate dehydrogenase [Litorivicinus sp.]